LEQLQLPPLWLDCINIVWTRPGQPLGRARYTPDGLGLIGAYRTAMGGNCGIQLWAWPPAPAQTVTFVDSSTGAAAAVESRSRSVDGESRPEQHQIERHELPAAMKGSTLRCLP
jgi:hypothetical protein